MSGATLTAKETFHARNPETGLSEVYVAGDPVPVAVAQRVGPSRREDLIDGKIPEVKNDPKEVLSFTRAEYDKAVREAADGKEFSRSELDEAVVKALADDAEERAAADEAGEGTFDPRVHDAKPVYDYLDALPDTVLGEAEFQRVVWIENLREKPRVTAVPERTFEYADEPDPDAGE